MGLRLFQTVEDRDNPDEIECQGPFKCIKNPWLGVGYYFWDTFIELAHWWGKQGYNKNYVICETFYDNNPDDIFDLVGNTAHLMELKNYVDILKSTYKKKFISVGFVIEHMKKFSSFQYKAIRANAINSASRDEYLKSQRLKFTQNNISYLELIPPFQICIIDKKYIGEGNYKIVYPETYCNEYAI